MSSERNLGRLAEKSFERRGDYPAVFFEGAWHSSAELHERSHRLAAGLAERGVGEGDRVVVSVPNHPDVGPLYNAIWRLGAVVTPAVFILSEDELNHIVTDIEAAAVIREDDLESLGADGDAPFVERDSSDLAAVLYTGGTTGRSKGVMLTHENLWLAGKHGHDSGYVPGIVRTLTALPLSHAFGLLVTVVGLQAKEPPVSVLMRWFHGETWLELAQEHRIQLAAVVPSMLYLLLSLPLEDYDLPELCYLASGAAPLALDSMREVRRRIPSVEVREGYGLTETSALVSTNPPGRIREGSVGLPIPGTEVRIHDDQDQELPVGEVGEICVRSELVMQGYWRDAEQTADAMRGGWLHTGDLGRLDEDGYLYVVDRKKDLIIRGGFNVFPRDVEEALLEHPAIAEACVVGRPDPRHGEEVVAFVALSGEATPDELVAFGKERLGGYKYPREVHVVSSLPLTPIGKVDRKAVRALLS